MQRSTSAVCSTSASDNDFSKLGVAWDELGIMWDPDLLEICITPNFPPRLFAWSLSLSAILWYGLIAAGHELWKVCR